MITVNRGVQVGWGLEQWGGVCSVNGGSGESQPSPKMPTPPFGGGSHLGVPWRGALLGRFEQE